MTPAEFRQARQLLGLSQAQLAETLGFRKAHISDMETGKMPIMRTTEIAMRAMAAFGTPDKWPS